MNNLKIGTFNVRGMRDQDKRLQTFKFIRDNEFDLIFLQEMHSSEGDHDYWSSQWSSQIIFSHGATNARGVAILIHKRAKIRILSHEEDLDGRVIYLKADLDGIEVLLVNLYAPNNDDPEFFINIANKIDEYESDNIIIGGDFNLVLDLQQDKIGGALVTHHKCRDKSDIWRIHHSNESVFTWHRYKPEPVYVRLDFFLVSSSLRYKIINTMISPGFRSDHDIPIMIVSNRAIKRGPGFWKFNTSLLEDDENCATIRKIITEEKAKQYKSDTDKLDYIKLCIRSYTIKYSSHKKKSRDNRLQILNRKIESEKAKLINNQHFFSYDNTVQHIINMEKEREEIVQYRLIGAMIRSRRDWLEKGEKTPRCFLVLRKIITGKTTGLNLC